MTWTACLWFRMTAGGGGGAAAAAVGRRRAAVDVGGGAVVAGGGGGEVAFFDPVGAAVGLRCVPGRGFLFGDGIVLYGVKRPACVRVGCV